MIFKSFQRASTGYELLYFHHEFQTYIQNSKKKKKIFFQNDRMDDNWEFSRESFVYFLTANNVSSIPNNIGTNPRVNELPIVCILPSTVLPKISVIWSKLVNFSNISINTSKIQKKKMMSSATTFEKIQKQKKRNFTCW